VTNKLTVSIEGGKEISKRLKALGKKAKIVKDDATLAGAEVIREEAASRANKLSGELSKNMQAELMDSEAETSTAGVGPHKEQFYGLFLEFGTDPHEIEGNVLQIETDVFRHSVTGGGTPPSPFLRPAFDAKKKEAVAAVAKHLRRTLNL